MKYPTTVVSDGKYYNIDLDSEMESAAPGSSIRHARENDLLGLAYRTAGEASAAMPKPASTIPQAVPTTQLLTPEGHPLRTDIHPEAQSRMDRTIARAKSEGIDVRMVRGNRTAEDQADLYAMGRTKPGDRITNAKPGTSNHESGRAFDLAIHNDKGEIDWKDARMQRVAAIAKSEGLKWGGDWKSFKDVPHFEYDGPDAAPKPTTGASYTPPATGTVWERVRSYDQFTNAAAIKYGISPDLIRSVMRYESGGDPKAISTSNAKGLMQHLDGTWADMGGGDVFDPATSIDHGAKYLSQLKKEFGSDRTAIVAYHQGPGTTRRSLGKAVGPQTQAYERDVMASVSEEQNPPAPRLSYTAAARQNFASNDPRLPVVLEGMRLMGHTPEQFGDRMQNPEFLQEYYAATMKHAETINPKLTIANGEQAYVDALKSVRGPNEPSQHPTPTVGTGPNPPAGFIRRQVDTVADTITGLASPQPAAPVSQGGASGSWSNGASGTWTPDATTTQAEFETKSSEQRQDAYDVVGRTVGKVAANLTRLAEDAIFAVVPRSADSSERASDVIQGGTDAMFGKPRNQTDVVVGGLLEFYVPFAKIAKPLAAAVGLTGKTASTVAGFATTVAQNPDDPTNSEAIESLIRGSDQPSVVRELINKYILGQVGQSEFEQRLWKRMVRGTEDAVFGLALDIVVPLYRGIVTKIGEYRNYHTKPPEMPVKLVQDAPDGLQGTPQGSVDSSTVSVVDAPRIDPSVPADPSIPEALPPGVQHIDIEIEKSAPATSRVGKDLQSLQEPNRLDSDGINRKFITRSPMQSSDGSVLMTNHFEFGKIRTPQDMTDMIESVTRLMEVEPHYQPKGLYAIDDIVEQTGATKAEVQSYLSGVPGGAPGPRTNAIMLMSEQAQLQLRGQIEEYFNPMAGSDEIPFNSRQAGRNIADLVTVIGDIGRQFRHDYSTNNSLGILSMTPEGKLRITNPRALQGDVLVDDAKKMILHLDDLFRNSHAASIKSTGKIRALDEVLDAETGSLGSSQPGQNIGGSAVHPSSVKPKPVKEVADYARGLTSPTFGGAMAELWFNSVLGAFKTVSKTAWSAGEQLLLKPAIRFFGALEQSHPAMKKLGESPEMMEAVIMYKSMIAGLPEMVRTMGNKLFHNVDTYLEKGGSLGAKQKETRQFRAEAFEDIPFLRRIPLIGSPTKIPGVASFLNTTGAILEFVGGRGLATIDEGLHFQVQRYELRAHAYRKSQGMVDLTAAQKLDWAENYIDEFTQHGRIDDETRAIITQQKKMSSMMQELGNPNGGFTGLGKFVQKLDGSMHDNPLLRVMFPFAKSAFNTFQLKAEMTPGLNLVSKNFRDELGSRDPWTRAEAEGRMLTGMVLATAAAGMGAAGISRGIQTTNPDYKRELERAGIPNNSITILGHTMRLDPNGVLGWFMGTFGALGAMANGVASNDDELSAAEVALYTLAELLKSAPYASAISDLMTTSDPRRLAARIEQEGIGKVGLLTVDDVFLKPLWGNPAGRGLQELIAIFQPHKRIVDTYMDRVTARNGFGLDNPVQTDILGRVRFKGNGLSESSLNNAVVTIAALDLSTQKDPLSLKLTRHGIHIPDPSGAFEKFGATVRLTDLEQQTLREMVFKPTGAAATLREALEKLVARDDWNSLHPHTAQLFVDDLVGDYVTVAKSQFYNRTPGLQARIKDKLKIQDMIK